MATLSNSDRPPTSSITQVLLAFAIGMLLALLLDARAVIHAGDGMTQGPLRVVTVRIGRIALQAAQTTHLTWPRDELDALLGHKAQPAVPPLLAATAPTAAPTVTVPLRQAAIATSTASTPASLPSRLCDCATPAPPSVAPTVTPTAGTATALAAPSPVPASPTPSLPLVRATVASAATARSSPTPTLPPLRQPTTADPLRLLVTGDSLTGYLGPELVNEAAAIGPVQGFVDTHNGTGLTSPSFVDWSVVAAQQVAQDHPDAIVVLIGGNDFQNMTLPDGKFFLAGSAAWTQEYARRAAICMRIWAQGGKARVYWLAMPPARNPQWAHDDAQINIALQQAAAQVAGTEYLDILGPITNHGQYADFVKNAAGQPILIREQDGVHLNIAGSTIVAHEVLPVIKREWRLTLR